MDIQQFLDDLLAGNPDLQKYVLKLVHVTGPDLPAGVTHTLQLQSAQTRERQITVGLVVKPQYAIILDAILSLIATTPPA